MITQSELQKLLHYDPETGLFTWLPRPKSMFKTARAFNAWNTRYSGKGAGCIQKIKTNKYIVIKIHDHLHYAHRLAWLYVKGILPEDQIDHIDGNGTNNAYTNLRDVDSQENSKNAKMYSNNKSGKTGVTWNQKHGKWHANITIDGKQEYLGCFNDLKLAISAREDAERSAGFHVNHGRSL